MKVRMLETRCGTENGYTIRRYYADEIYEIADGLAQSFLAAGFAVRLPNDNDAPKIQKKRRKPPPQAIRTSSSTGKAGSRSGKKRPILSLIKE